MGKFRKITIIGVGLIGGSIALAIKKKRLAVEIIGVFRHQSTLKKALRRKAVDRAVMNIKDGVKDADLIILATPVSSIVKIAPQVIENAKNGAVLTDVGSTKKWVVEKIEKMTAGSSVRFVGSHPMAGSDHTGVEFARNDLLENAPCIVTKTQKTDKTALKKVAVFWRSLGARVEVMSPSRHDRSVSLISHLPHLVAFSLAGAIPEKELVYAAEGFKDTTRVASSDPELWSDIFFTNKKEIVKAARKFEKYYRKIVDALSKGERSKALSALRQAKSKRDKFVYGVKD